MSDYWPFTRLRNSAADWFVRLRAQPVTPQLDVKFQRWLASDRAHEEDYERQELTWELAGELACDAEIEGLIAEAQRATAPRRRPSANVVLRWSATAAVLVAAICIGVYLQWPSSTVVYMTAAGEQRTVVLPDQSRMTLNTSTLARVKFNRKVRVIELEHGEATFSVTHDADRPFEVRAAKGTARALGTEFNVLSLQSDVTVAVLTGKVEVIAPDTIRGERRRSAVLTHGQEITYNDSAISQIQPADAARINAWRSGRIAFQDVDLPEALREFNRYGGTPIVLGDASLASVRVSGVFRIGETDALLSALNVAFQIEAERHEGAIELRRQTVQ